MTIRKPFLDNIRWSMILLVMAYHVGYFYNNVGILGGIPGAENLPLVDTLCAFVYPWFMVLLFLVSGVCARYALERRTAKAFLGERARKLLVPSTLGLFVIHWATGWLNIKMGGGLAYIPAFLVYPISVISGVGPLWFAHSLFLFSAALLVLRKLDQKDRLWTLGGKVRGWMLPLLCLPLWAAAQVGNLPVLTMYRFGIYFAAFLMGYLVLSHEPIQKKLTSMALPLGAAALLCGIVWTAGIAGKNFTEDSVLRCLFTNVYAWLAALAVFALMARYGNRETPVTRYLGANSYGFYVLHYPVMLWIAYGLHLTTGLPAWGKYGGALILGILGTAAMNEIFKRIPVLRWLVLGIKSRK